MTIRWITDRLGTAAGAELAGRTDLCIVDVRDMVDKAGNRPEAVRRKLDEGAAALAAGKTTVVCCDYGISRSNAVAAGILAVHEGLGLDAAIRRIQASTGEAEIKLEPLAAVRAALEGSAGKPAPDRRRLLLTGGTGFLGAALRRRLEGRYEIVAPDRAALDIESGGTALDLLAGESSTGAIVHLANPRVYTSNVALGRSLSMLRNVIDVCLSRSLPLVYLSGWEIYSGYPGDLLAKEATPPLPKGPYGETKYLAEVLIGHLRRTEGLSCALLRSSPVYGPGGARPKFIHTFLEKARRGDPITTHRYRNGDPALDLLHIDDLVSAMVLVLDNGFVGDLNLGTGVVTSTPEIARLIAAAAGGKSTVGHVDIDADTARVAMDASAAQKALGWSPTIGFKDGLKALLVSLG